MAPSLRPQRAVHRCGTWILLLTVLAGCRSSDPLNRSYSGQATGLDSATLAFDLEARPDTAGLVVWVGIDPARLPFLRRGDRLGAAMTLDFSLQPEAGHASGLLETVQDTVWKEGEAPGAVGYAHLIHRRFAASPGTYRLEATLHAEGETVQQAVRVVVPAPDLFTLLPIRLDADVGEGTPHPMLALQIPAPTDSLRASIPWSGTPSTRDTPVTLVLIRYPTDTLAAQPPNAFVGAGALAYRGARFEGADTLARWERRFPEGQGDGLSAALPSLTAGLYRLVATAGGQRQERLLCIVPAAFPRIRSLPEMVEALQYLLTRREQRHFAEAPTADALRDAFDRFWGRTMGNRDAARARLQRYFARVEEANLYFSTFKPGWKTDRGMVYVVLGPPLHVETWPDREVWHYSYDEGDERFTYVFERVREVDVRTPFTHYVLVRGDGYQRAWARAIRAWREPER